MRARWSGATASSAAFAARRSPIRIIRDPSGTRRRHGHESRRRDVSGPASCPRDPLLDAAPKADTPDRNPVIGHSRTTPGLIHAFGFSGAGFQIAPGVGEVVADLVRDG